MTFLASFLIFVAISALVSVLGMKLWVRPKEAIERVTGVDAYIEEKAPTHPSLAFREMLDRLGSVLPTSPKDMSAMQKRLVRAGIDRRSVPVFCP